MWIVTGLGFPEPPRNPSARRGPDLLHHTYFNRCTDGPRRSGGGADAGGEIVGRGGSFFSLYFSLYKSVTDAEAAERKSGELSPG